MAKPPIETDDTTEKVRRKPRNIGRIVHEINRLFEDEPEKLEFLGSVPDIPQSNIRLFIKKNYGAGFFLIQTKQGGKFKSESEITIQDLPKQSEPEEMQNNYLEISPEIEDEEEFIKDKFDENDSKTSEILSFLLQKIEKLDERLEERQENLPTSQNAELLMMRELSRQNEKNLDRYIGLLQNSIQSQQQPQQDPTAMMLQMLQGTLAVQKGVRELSEEIAPNDTGGGSSSLLSDGAKLLDAVGRNAGTFLPVIGGLLGRLPNTPAQVVRQPATPAKTNGNGQSGGLADLAKKVQKKEVIKNEK